MNPIKIFIADDHNLFRAGLIELLQEEEDFLIVGETSNEKEVYQSIIDTNPDVVLMDIDFGHNKEYAGIDVTEKITLEQDSQISIIMLTMHDEDSFVIKAFEAGAKGYVLKRSDPKTLMKTIRDVAKGGVILTSQQAEKVLNRFRQLRRHEIDEPFVHLTDGERKILQLVAEGITNPEIAEKLGVSKNTIRNRLALIFTKLHVNNRTQAAQMATKYDLFPKEE